MTKRASRTINLASRRYFLTIALGAPAAVALSACGAGQGPPPRTFTITLKSTYPEELPAVDWALEIEEPQAGEGIDTTRIALLSGGTEIQYYAKAVWSARAPEMLTGLMVDSFKATDRISAVGDRRTRLRPDFRLKTVLRAFQAEGAPGEAPEVKVLMAASLEQLPKRNQVGAEEFRAVVPASSDKIEDIVLAFDEAFGKVMKRMVEWALVTGQEAYTAAG